MAQTTLITDLVSLVTPNNNDVFVVVDNTSDPSLSVTKKISYADLKESLQDMIDTMVTEGTGINASYSDVANTLTLSVVADTTLQKGIVSSGGTEIGQRQEINFIPGASVTLSGTDNASDNRVDLTINTTAVSTSVNTTVSGSSYNVLSSINTLGDGTKELEFRPIKAASTKAVVNYGDSDNSITIDVNPGAIPITDLDTSAPLPVNLGGTGGNTAALARGGIGAAKAGANSDITSLSALTTPLSVAQGGTGGNTTQDALENLQGLKFVESVGIAGESIVATNSKVVGGEYRAEIKGLQAGSNKLQITSTNNDITLDIDADNVLGAASQNVDLNGYRLTNIGAPIGTSDAATKDYVDSRSQGFAVKASAVAATTASLSGTYNGGPDFTFTLAPTGTPTIDSVGITATGTRVLFKDQANGYENGIYELTTSGDFGVNAVFTRAEDYDSDVEILAGTIVFIESGSTNAGKQFIQITSEPTIDADPLEFAVLSDTIIPQGSVTNVKLDNMDALRVKGTLTAGVPQDLTPDNVIEIVNSGTTEIDEPRLPKATTSATGLTRLYDDVDSVSSSRAATANAVKTAYDAAISASGDAATAQSAANAAQATADAALPVSGGTMTGLINFAVGQDFPGEVEASGSTLTDGTYLNPTLTGITSAPTQPVGTSDNQIATTAFVNAEIANDAPTKTGSGASGTWEINVTGNAGTATKLATPRTINLGGDLSGSAAFDGSGNITLSGTVVNNSVALGANTTGSYVANATTSGNGIGGSVNTEGGTFTVTSNATSASTANTIVFRNGSGNFSANLITASLDGNASTATKLATARTIELTGDISGSASFDGSNNINISTAIGNDALALGTNTTGNYVAVGATSGNGISGSSSSEGGTFTVTSNATSANTAGTIVYRDGNGNFNAGTITASLDGNASTASSLANTRTISLAGDVTGSASFDGSSNITITSTIADDSHDHVISNVDGLQAVLDTKAPVVNAALSGAPTAPTAIAGNASTLIANTQFVANAVATAISDAQSGSVASADKLTTPRTINTVSFDGTANIVVEPYVEDDETTNANRYLVFVDNSTAGHKRLNEDSSLTYNPSSNTLAASVFNGNLTGNAATATLASSASEAASLSTPRTIAFGGDLSGSASFDGTSDVTITATIGDDSHNHVIGNIDNLQTTLDAKAPLASPSLTGTPTAPTATAGTNTTQIATTAFVGTAVSNLVNGAPEALNTLDELAQALSDDADFATTVTNSIATKLPLAGGEMTGNITFSGTQTVDGRDLSVDGSKLDNIEDNAQVNVKADWNATTGDAEILNKPTIPPEITDNSQIENGAGYITSSGSISGNAATATKLATERTISLAGDVTGSVSFDGSANASIATTIASGVIVNADISNSAAIAGTKVVEGTTSARGTLQLIDSTSSTSTTTAATPNAVKSAYDAAVAASGVAAAKPSLALVLALG